MGLCFTQQVTHAVLLACTEQLALPVGSPPLADPVLELFVPEPPAEFVAEQANRVVRKSNVPT